MAVMPRESGKGAQFPSIMYSSSPVDEAPGGGVMIAGTAIDGA